MTGYELSKDWFNYCFENPEIVKPNHTALYFFIIEHCNRLGWKKKFGLPTEMAKEAIGIRSYNTYIETLHDLMDWKFVTLIEKSKNQYSSNIISITKLDQESGVSNYDKALDKAEIKHLIKHSIKQGESTEQSIDSIIKLLTNNIEPITNNIDEFEKFILSLPKEKKEKNTWRADFDIYLSECTKAYNDILLDSKFITEQEKFHPGVDISLSLEKSYTNFWGCEAGWKHKKKSRSNEIDWIATFRNAIDLNKVYKQRNTQTPNQQKEFVRPEYKPLNE